jgi:hypothetical protein
MKRGDRVIARLIAQAAILLLPTARSAAADFVPVPLDIDRYRRESVEQKPSLLKEWKKRVTAREQALGRGRAGVVVTEISTEVDWPQRGWVKFKSQEAKKAWLERTTAKLAQTRRTLAELESGSILPAPYFQAPILPGQVGMLGPVKLDVLQVIDAQNMLVETPIEYKYREGASESKRLIWIHGVSTADIKAGTSIKPDEDIVYRVVGTRQYNATTGGLNAVLVLEPLGEDQLRSLQSMPAQ